MICKSKPGGVSHCACMVHMVLSQHLYHVFRHVQCFRCSVGCAQLQGVLPLLMHCYAYRWHSCCQGKECNSLTIMGSRIGEHCHSVVQLIGVHLLVASYS